MVEVIIFWAKEVVSSINYGKENEVVTSFTLIGGGFALELWKQNKNH